MTLITYIAEVEKRGYEVTLDGDTVGVDSKDGDPYVNFDTLDSFGQMYDEECPTDLFLLTEEFSETPVSER